MPDYWTKEQSEANAELNAQEFANRQILLRGSGTPAMQAPIGAEYEDTSSIPPIRFRKVGTSPSDWITIPLIEAASEQEVNTGTDNAKMVTPLTLAGRLDAFASDVLGLLESEPSEATSAIVLTASVSTAGANFTVELSGLPPDSTIGAVINGYGVGATLSNIIGGPIGTIITLRRGESHALAIDTSTHIKLPASFLSEDPSELDNVTLQRISDSVWVELARKKFT